MTTERNTDVAPSGETLEKMTQNLKKVEELSERLQRVLVNKKGHHPSLDGPNQELFGRAAQAYWAEMGNNPAKILEHQMSYWSDTMKHFVQAQQTLAKGKLEAPEDTGPSDRRFSNPLWSSHPYFNYVKKQYLINAEAITKAVEGVTDLDPKEKNRLNYFAKQIVDMMSPTNFLATNPDALMVPEQAIWPIGNDKTLYIVEEGVANQRTVTIGDRKDGLVEVTSNLSAGEEIVVAGQMKIFPGAKVRPIPSAGTGGSP